MKAPLVDWLSVIIGPTYEQVPQPETVGNALSRTLAADFTKHGKHGAFVRLAAPDILDIGSFKACKGCLLVVTEGRFMGLVPQSAEVGDEIYLLAGRQVFYCLQADGDHFRLLGEFYVHGLMDGEALELLEKGEAQLRTVRIKEV